MLKAQDKHFLKKDIQTHLKHALLEDYIINWASIIASASLSVKIKRIHFVDGFAGKGSFEDGQNGSPKIAINKLFDLQRAFYENYKSSEMKFFIHTIESYPEFQVELDKLKTNTPFPNQITNYKGKFEDHIPTVLKCTMGSPSLYFIDPFGYKGVRMQDVHAILSQQSHEVLINVMSYSLVRNINIENNRKELCLFFGVEEIPSDISQYVKIANETNQLSLIGHSLEKLENHIIDFYKTQLTAGSPVKTYTLSKRIYSSANPNVYFHLVFATRNRRGLIAMKNSMVEFETISTHIEQMYIEQNGLNMQLMNDLFSDANALDGYSYRFFVQDFIKVFNKRESLFGEIIDFFLQNSPLPFRDKDGNRMDEKSIYGYFIKLQKSMYIQTTGKAFADHKQFDEIIINANFPDNYSIEEPSEIIQNLLF